MNIAHLLEDDDAVSPVISTVLMVAVTVVIASVVGTFVLGLGNGTSEPRPNTHFTFEYEENAIDADGDHGRVDDAVNITHESGQNIDTARITVTIDGVSAYNDSRINKSGPNQPYPMHFNGANDGWNDEISAGDRIVITENEETVYDSIREGDSVKVIWTAPDGDETAVLAESEVQF
jgi:FlaG/FlaF family flagellin (archaellin)